MRQEWRELIELTREKDFTVQAVKMVDSGISIQGEFELPPLARLNGDDQLFVAMFLQTHGSIKEMEKLFGISYPTVKSRLSRIANQLGGAIVEPANESDHMSRAEVLAKIEKGEMKVEDALEYLK